MNLEGYGLLYAAGPLAYIVEKAGGRARAGDQGVCEIIPQDIHSRTSCRMGSSTPDINTRRHGEE